MSKPIVLNSASFDAVIPFSAPERTRYAFDGVKVDPANRTVTGTDGKILFSVKSREKAPEDTRWGTNGFAHSDDEEAFLANPHSIAAALRPTRRKHADRDAVVASNSESLKVSVRWGDDRECIPQNHDSQMIEGAFPNFAPLFAEKEGDNREWTFNAYLLERITKAAKALNRGNDSDMPPLVKFTLNDDPNIRALFEILPPSGCEFETESNIGAIMPISK